MTEIDEGGVLERHRSSLCSLLKIQTRLTDRCLAEITSGKMRATSVVSSDLEVIDTVIMMLQGVGVSAHSILRLSETLDMNLRDCFSISRSVVESSINVAYIVAGGPEIAAHARRHALQKSYRDLERAGTVGDWSFGISAQHKPEVAAVAGLQEALDEFSDARGRERRDWTKDNLEKRLNLIEQRFSGASLNFAAAIMQIYRHSSEIIHGTYFGTAYFWQCPTHDERPSKHELLNYFLSNHLLAVVSSAFFAQGGVLEVMARRYDFSALHLQNSELFHAFSEYVQNDFAKMN
jgi:hypothetical protein